VRGLVVHRVAAAARAGAARAREAAAREAAARRARRRPGRRRAVLEALFAVAVVDLALLLVGQHVVRLGDLLEAPLGDLLVVRVLVGVPLHRELAVGLLECVGVGVFVDAEDLVVVLAGRHRAGDAEEVGGVRGRALRAGGCSAWRASDAGALRAALPRASSRSQKKKIAWPRRLRARKKPGAHSRQERRRGVSG
jgi:hypothetical protein